MEIQFGQVGASIVLTVILGVTFRLLGEKLANKWKPLIAIVAGVGIGLLAIPYNGLPWIANNIIDYAIHGLMIGAGATGLYELQKTATKIRT